MEKTILTRKELYDLVWSESLTAVSKRFNVKYTALRRICKEMNVPVPPNGHWSKLQFGKPVEIIELPQGYTGVNEINLYPIQTETNKPEILTFHKKTLADLIKEDETLPLKVPKTLTNPEELVLAAQKKLMEYKYSKYHDNGMVRYEGAFVIRVSRHNIGRALRFMDALLKLLRARGHNLDTKYTHSLYIDEVPCEFKLMEKTQKASQQEKWGFTRFETTGLLYFEIKGYGGRVWTDGKVLIEKRLASILTKIESKVSEMLECWRQNAEHKREREEKERLMREQKERVEKEKSDFKQLINQAKRLQTATFLRQYIDVVEERLQSIGSITDESKQWVKWARDKAAWFDPLCNVEDSVLGFYDPKKMKDE